MKRIELTIKVDDNLLYTAGGYIDEPLGVILHKFVQDYIDTFYDKEISHE